MESHLLQMRGLKHELQTRCHNDEYVASFTDAWIETPRFIRLPLTIGRIFYRCVDWNSYKEIIEGRFDVSHLLQMRGLKHGK